MQEIVRRLAEKRAAAELGGGEARIETQHAKGKLTAPSGSNYCSIPARSKNGTCSSSTAAPTSEWASRAFRATASSRATAR